MLHTAIVAAPEKERSFEGCYSWSSESAVLEPEELVLALDPTASARRFEQRAIAAMSLVYQSKSSCNR